MGEVLYFDSLICKTMQSMKLAENLFGMANEENHHVRNSVEIWAGFTYTVYM